MRTTAISASLLALSLATGCGALFYDGDVAVRGRTHASATVRVESAQHIDGSRVVVVEQQAGEGFVLSGGGAAAGGHVGSTAGHASASGRVRVGRRGRAGAAVQVGAGGSDQTGGGYAGVGTATAGAGGAAASAGGAYAGARGATAGADGATAGAGAYAGAG
ncbi:MAG TPA: hypothetical protein RMH99_28800, partial [Sandaracinaceae bacterium LLY-WYZ-13_1]|nr:hypothetical protein [Sandaracinaceae bacterium LLY-WYZ-13_1]